MSLLCVLLSPVSPGKVKALYDTQTPMCPICHAVLRPGELQEHMEQEIERIMQLRNRYILQFIESIPMLVQFLWFLNLFCYNKKWLRKIKQ